MAEKLTKAQRELLVELSERDSRMHLWATYKPIMRLHELGLVDKREHALSSPSFAITPAGRAALESSHDR
ncbi:hypothetical protein [Bosea sp. AS-1]|uniref:hypothetical protein n=1 Tax=Bosea sp. AS-1 TaxID=2015316 RepID=UPI000B7787DE|nr:hypothetical protein [Bosea sp. AS-1]